MPQLLVLSTDRYDTLARYDVLTKRIEHFKPNDFPSEVNGIFSTKSGRQVCFFRLGDKLHLRIDEEDFELMNNIEIDVKHVSNSVNCISIFDSKRNVFHTEYPRALDPKVFDITNVEEEDLDLLLLACNVWKDPKRRRIIFTRIRA